MTGEEAIRCLSVHSSTNGSGLCTDKQHYEAKQMGIEAIKMLKSKMDGHTDTSYEWAETVRLAIKALEQESKTGWIPVSEMLPAEDGFYLATCDGEICGESEPFSGLAEFQNGKWVDDEEDYQCVVAWMPLPTPYKPQERRCEE